MLVVATMSVPAAQPDDHDVQSPSGSLFGGFPAFHTPLPQSADAWRESAPKLRRTLWSLLGDIPASFTPSAKIKQRVEHDDFFEERVEFFNGLNHRVFGLLLIPKAREKHSEAQRRPAVLYHHYHGGKYEQGKEELLRPAFREFGGGDLIPGHNLVRKGFVVLAIDAYGFGERRYESPASEQETGSQVEASLFKAFAWQGRTLWGMIVHDDLLALNYLISRAEVDPARIGAMGMSMGATRSWWAAALDERIRCTVSVACLTRYQDLLAQRQLNFHGIYYYVPGVLKERIDMEAVCGLIAPRAHLTLTGDRDPGSPASGVRTVNGFQERLYALFEQSDRFRGLVYEGVGHAYTPEMWSETVRFLDKHLAGTNAP